jgi:dipeptidyl aminopeptidase/acylaminoacyl peptidase
MHPEGELGNVGAPSVSWSYTRTGGPGDQKPWRGVIASTMSRADHGHHERREHARDRGVSDKQSAPITKNTTTDSGLRFSPDGKKIVFTAMTGGNAEVYEIPALGGEAKNISRNPANDGFPCYSPYGKSIVFVSDREGNLAIYVMQYNGSEVKRLTSAKSDDTIPHCAGTP